MGAEFTGQADTRFEAKKFEERFTGNKLDQ
jgi:hypothetical protein